MKITKRIFIKKIISLSLKRKKLVKVLFRMKMIGRILKIIIVVLKWNKWIIQTLCLLCILDISLMNLNFIENEVNFINEN
jgi:hypothetical protein